MIWNTPIKPLNIFQWFFSTNFRQKSNSTVRYNEFVPKFRPVEIDLKATSQARKISKERQPFAINLGLAKTPLKETTS